MPSGIQVWDASGNLTFDSNDAAGGCVADIVASTTSSQVKNYSIFAGRSAFVVLLKGYVTGSVTISYGSGYPSITFPATGAAGDAEWVVFVY